MKHNTTPPIQSLDRGLIILEKVGQSNKPVSLGELTDILGIDRSSVFRLANTLKLKGFLAFASGTKDYVLGASVWRLSHQCSFMQTLIKISKNTLKALAADTGETAHTAVLDHQHVLIVDHKMSHQPLGVSVKAGDKNKLYCTSVGKVLISEMEKDTMQKYLGEGPLVPFTENTITSPDALYEHCQEIREKGYAFDNEEFIDGIRCVAAPIRDATGAIVASVAISAPANRLPDQDVEQTGQIVIHSGIEISQLLGFWNNGVK